MKILILTVIFLLLYSNIVKAENNSLFKIPVIVITAKDLTEEERQLLVQNDVNSMWKKGQIDREKLIAQVKAQLE